MLYEVITPKAKVEANNVLLIREGLLMSKAELARRAGLSVLTIDRVEKGMTVITSYSIHYTKLYESLLSFVPGEPKVVATSGSTISPPTHNLIGSVGAIFSSVLFSSYNFV